MTSSPTRTFTVSPAADKTSPTAALDAKDVLTNGATTYTFTVTPSNTVGVGVRWNLFDGGQTRNRAAAMRRDSEALHLRANDLRSQIELQVREAWFSLGEARARIAVTRESVAQAQENLRTSRELYSAGLASNTQVLDAVALALNASNNRDDAVLDAEFAKLRLARATGSL